MFFNKNTMLWKLKIWIERKSFYEKCMKMATFQQTSLYLNTLGKFGGLNDK